ncbi:hypothetical protein ACKUSY_00920 [Myroides odoratus]
MKGTNDCQIGQKSIHQKSNSQKNKKYFLIFSVPIVEAMAALVLLDLFIEQ